MSKNTVKYLVSFVAVFSVTFFASFVFAQEGQTPQAPTKEEINAQAAEERGPSAAEMANFEKEFGGPPQSFPEPAIEKPQFEQPGTIPDEIKKYVSDTDLVAVYCAMTRWKSGQFFSAMDAVKKYVIEPVNQVKSDFGIDLNIPDVDAIKAEGAQRVQAICDVSTVADAEKLARDFSDWGQNQNQEKFDAMRAEMQDKLKTRGDALRDKVKAELQPFIDEQKSSIEKEIQTLAEQIVDQKKEEITARFSNAKAAPDVSGLKDEITQAVNSAIQSKIEQRKSEMQSEIQAKVQEIIGPEKAKFEKIAETFQDVSQKINDYIKANESQYDQYKKQAFELRKSLVFKILDANIEEGLKQLDASAADIEEARKQDASIKSAAEIKSEIAKDKEALGIKLDAALESGDESAFQAALNDFRVKWETFRQDSEKAAAQSVSKACTTALAQFSKAEEQIDSNLPKIQDLQTKCSGSVSDECLKVNEFLPRFGTLTAKFTDIKTEMGLAEKMCQAPETADRKNLIALMKKIQSDAEDVKTYGEALEAEKNKAIAESADAACSNLLPQLRAAKAEISKNDLVSLKVNIAGCANKNTEQCKVINGLRPQVAEFETQVASFVKNADAAEKICQGNKTEKDMFDLQAAGNALKTQGETIKEAGKKLEAEQAEKGSEKAFCRAAVPSLNIAKTKINSGLGEMNAIKSECQGKQDNRCQDVNSLSASFDLIASKSDSALKQAGSVETACQNAGTKTPDPALIQQLDDLAKTQIDIEKIVADLKSSIDALRASKGSIWIEAESATSFNKRLGVSNPMAREINPSWRPPYFGDGSWYMGAGGDYLIYNFKAPAKGSYNVWVRDLASNIPSQMGQGVITIYFDGKSIGSFAENTQGRIVPYPKGAFYWHKVGIVALAEGTHVMKIEKQSSTSRAADLDAFYLTTGDDVPPEK